MLKDNKSKMILLFAMITYIITGLSTAISTKLNLRWQSILLGLFFLSISFFFLIYAKRKNPIFNILSCCLSPLSIGFTLGAYFSYIGKIIPLHIMILDAIPYSILIITSCILCKRFTKTKLCSRIFGAFLLIIMIFCAPILHSNIMLHYFFFMVILLFFYFILAYFTFRGNRSILSDLSFCSYFWFLPIIYPALKRLTHK